MMQKRNEVEAGAGKMLEEEREKARKTVLCLLNCGCRFLDENLLFSDCSLPQNIKHILWEKAAAIGKAWVDQYWNTEANATENLYRLGAVHIRFMSPMEECAYHARALYDPDGSQIMISRSRLEEMSSIQEELDLYLFTEDSLRERLLAHECFHFLEEKKGQHLNEIFSKEYGFSTNVLSPCRDIGAQAFVNQALGDPPAQAVDIMWLAVKAPEKLPKMEEI